MGIEREPLPAGSGVTHFTPAKIPFLYTLEFLARQYAFGELYLHRNALYCIYVIYMDIRLIIQAIESDRIRISDHADDEAQEDELILEEIFHSVSHGEIIEDYPTDKSYPSCLIYGNNVQQKPIHSVWAYNAQTQWAVLITVYRPDPNRWINWRERRK